MLRLHEQVGSEGFHCMKKIWPALALGGMSALFVLGTLGMTRTSSNLGAEDSDLVGYVEQRRLQNRTDKVILADYLAQMQDLISESRLARGRRRKRC